MKWIVSLALVLAFAAPAAAQPAVCDQVAAARAVFGSAPLMPATALSILNSIAWNNRPTWGLVAACPGCNGLELSNGRRVRLDRLIRRGDWQLYDVFVDGPLNTPGAPVGPGASGPSCREDGDDERLFVAPVEPAGGSVDPGIDPLPIEGLETIVSLLGDFQADINRRIDGMPTKGDLEAVEQRLAEQLAAHDKKVDEKFEEARGWFSRNWPSLLSGLGGLLAGILGAAGGQ
jgi:hypothetical protein